MAKRFPWIIYLYMLPNAWFLIAFIHAWIGNTVTFSTRKAKIRLKTKQTNKKKTSQNVGTLFKMTLYWVIEKSPNREHQCKYLPENMLSSSENDKKKKRTKQKQNQKPNLPIHMGFRTIFIISIDPNPFKSQIWLNGSVWQCSQKPGKHFWPQCSSSDSELTFHHGISHLKYEPTRTSKLRMMFRKTSGIRIAERMEVCSVHK